MGDANAIEAVVAWMDAMRRGDLGAVREWFDPDVTWRGIPDDAVCNNRDEVLGMLGNSLVPCPEDPTSLELEPGLRGAEAVELLAPDPATAVLGAKVAALTEVGDVPLDGQLYNVFRVRGGRIVEVTDYAGRDEALAAAGGGGAGVALMAADSPSEIVDLVPFLRVSDVARSIGFYEALGFRVVKTYEPGGRLEFAGLESTSAAKVMLARVDRVPERDPDGAGPGFLYLYTSDLDAFCKRLLDHGIEPGEITGVPGPGPSRQMCVRDPDGYGHMVAELWPGSVGRDPGRPPRLRERLLKRWRNSRWPRIRRTWTVPKGADRADVVTGIPHGRRSDASKIRSGMSASGSPPFAPTRQVSCM